MDQVIAEVEKYIRVVLGELNRIGLQLEDVLPPEVTSSPLVTEASAALNLPVGVTLLAAAAVTLLITLLTLIISTFRRLFPSCTAFNYSLWSLFMVLNGATNLLCLMYRRFEICCWWIEVQHRCSSRLVWVWKDVFVV